MIDSDHTPVEAGSDAKPPATIQDIINKFLDVIGVDKDQALSRRQIIHITPELQNKAPYLGGANDADKEYVHINIKDTPNAQMMVNRDDRTEGLTMNVEVSRTQLPTEIVGESSSGKPEQDIPSVRADVAARLFNDILPRGKISDRFKLPDGTRVVCVSKNHIESAMRILNALEEQQNKSKNPLQGALAFGSELQVITARNKSLSSAKIAIFSRIGRILPDLEIYNIDSTQRGLLLDGMTAAEVGVRQYKNRLVITVPAEPEKRVPLLEKIKKNLQSKHRFGPRDGRGDTQVVQYEEKKPVPKKGVPDKSGILGWITQVRQWFKGK